MLAAPLYARVTEALRDRIGTGWRLGDRLPAEPALCTEYGVSSITMRRAVATLVAEGLLVRLQGKGTFVSGDHAIVQSPPQLRSFTQDMTVRGWSSSAIVVSISTENGASETCDRLGLPEGSQLTRIERVRLADGLPIAIQEAVLPTHLFPALETRDFGRESLYEVMRSVYGVQPATALETYRASTVTAKEAGLLEVAAGSAAFRAERLTQDPSGRKIEFIRSVIRGDRYTLQLKLTASRQAER